MEPFKLLLGPALVQACGDHLQRAWPGFDRAGFVALALDGLDGLELKGRALHIASALEQCLPADFDRAAGIIEAALAPPFEGEDLKAMRTSAAGLAGWICWPLGEFVVRRGLEQPERALAALHRLTRCFTAEWALRPFLLRHAPLCYATLARWVGDPNLHVRRLVSEGSRPRLPWGLQLKPLIADPRPNLPLLEALRADASTYVRRSVANHLNDIGRDHPQLLVDWVRRVRPHSVLPRDVALLRHASRGLLKRGHAGMLAAWGLDQPFAGTLQFELGAARVAIGQAIELRLALQAAAGASQVLEIDYRVWHRRADGSSAPKVFKGWQLQLPGGARRLLLRRHSLRPVSTRRYYPGAHRIELQVNGQVLASAGFELLD